MSASISSLFPAAQRDALQAQQALTAYESGADASQPAELRLHQTLDSLARACAEMELPIGLLSLRVRLVLFV